MIAIKTFDNKKNKEVTAGFIGDNFYLKEVKSNHFMVKHQGYGIQADILSKIVGMGIENIHIKTKTGLLISKVIDWVNKGVRENFGHGDQVFLNSKLYMKKG